MFMDRTRNCDLVKYPRTRHLEGSRKQRGDEDLKAVPFGMIRGKYLVLRRRSTGCGERQFDLFKFWAGVFQAALWETLGSRYVMYGEWMFAKHTVFYDRLPHYFMEFDIYDKETGRFFSTKKRREILARAPFVHSVLALDQGRYKELEEITRWIGPSHFISDSPAKSLEKQCRKAGARQDMTAAQTDLSGLMEGIYIKVEEGDYVADRLKYVRTTFLNAILDSKTHWMKRPIVPNRLAEGAEIF